MTINARLLVPTIEPELTATKALWGLVAIAFVGDLVTTAIGLHIGLAESNPVGNGAIELAGLAGMVALKTGAVAIAAACQLVLEREYWPIVPALLAGPWMMATLLNAHLIVRVIA